VAAVGVTLNILAVLLNAGKMPVWEGALLASGLTLADLVGDPFHVVLGGGMTAGQFVAAGGLFGDVVPIPVPILRDVVSVGDVLLWLGIVWAIVAAMTRPLPFRRRAVALGASPLRPMARSELQLGQAYATAVAADALHILTACLWLGALPALVLIAASAPVLFLTSSSRRVEQPTG